NTEDDLQGLAFTIELTHLADGGSTYVLVDRMANCTTRSISTERNISSNRDILPYFTRKILYELQYKNFCLRYE
ncbi:Hypothetical predicted protein, partial [Paramuricea clavata]